MNESTDGGFLTPIGVEPLSDDPLDDAVHDFIAGVTGLTPELVRPRWQRNPPNQPMHTTNWCSFGVTASDPDTHAYEGHDATGDGTSVVERDEVLTVLVSFYGPNAARNDARVRDGLQIVQNRFTLSDAGLAVVEYQKPVKIPALMKESWVPRVDATLILRRRTVRTYQIRTIVEVEGGLDNEHYVTPLKIILAP